MTTQPPRRGRPPGDPADRRTDAILVRLNPAERAALEAAATRDGVQLGVVLRDLGLRWARRGKR